MKPRICRIARVPAVLCCLVAATVSFAQDFKILWTTVGEVVSAGEDTVPLQRGAKVVRVDVEPAIVPIAAGKQVCISTLEVRAVGPDGRGLAGAPLTISVRDDQKLNLRLTRPGGDLCMRPASPGEYPIRFTSKLPAPDGTQRGAQIFLRAS
jgi:hypothetical protein